MFQRFTNEARQTVTQAQAEARTLRHHAIGTEHLLLALLRLEGTPSSAVLGRHNLTHDAVAESVTGRVGGGDLDADALAAVGIDLEAVRERVEGMFGPGALDAGYPAQGGSGHIPFSPRAKKVLELSLREALAMKSRSITDGHIALGLLGEGEGLAMTVLRDLGVDPVELRRDLTAALRT